MLSLPAVIAVQLAVAAGGSTTSLENILVLFEAHWHGNYCFGCWIGPTNEMGAAEITRGAVEQEFASSRTLFPMDYKAPIEEYDSRIACSVMGDGEFLEWRRDSVSHPIVTPEARAVIARARNEVVQSTRVWVDVPDVPPDRLHVEVFVELVRSA